MKTLRDLRRSLEAMQEPRVSVARIGQPSETLRIKSDVHQASTAIISDFISALVAHRTAFPETAGLVRVKKGKIVRVDPIELDLEIAALFERSVDFPPARLRSLATRACDLLVTSTLEQSAALDAYEDSLREMPNPWFRNYPATHLRVGVHTAVSAGFKMIEVAGGCALRAAPEGAGRQFAFDAFLDQGFEFLSFLATSHFALLLAANGTFWDSAASTPNLRILPGELDSQPFLVVNEESELELITAYGKEDRSEPRLGCPAMRSRSPDGSAVSYVLEWCREIGERFYRPLVSSLPRPLSPITP